MEQSNILSKRLHDPMMAPMDKKSRISDVEDETSNLLANDQDESSFQDDVISDPNVDDDDDDDAAKEERMAVPDYVEMKDNLISLNLSSLSNEIFGYLNQVNDAIQSIRQLLKLRDRIETQYSLYTPVAIEEFGANEQNDLHLLLFRLGHLSRVAEIEMNHLHTLVTLAPRLRKSKIDSLIHPPLPAAVLMSSSLIKA